MRRLRDGQGTLWDEFLPPAVRVLSDELAAIDTLLDDDRFLAPLRQGLMSRVGRPTIAMETYLRLMYLAPSKPSSLLGWISPLPATWNLLQCSSGNGCGLSATSLTDTGDSDS